MTLVTKIRHNPRISDRQLVSLILKSPKLTSAFGKHLVEDWKKDLIAKDDLKVTLVAEKD